MKRVSIFAVGVCAGLLTLGSASGGVSAPAPQPQADGGVVTLEGDHPDAAPIEVTSEIDDAEMRDLRTIAQQTGRPIDEVIDRYGWNDNFAVAVHHVRESSPDQVAGAAITDSGHAWVAFKQGVPETLAQRSVFDGLPAQVDVELRANVGFSERQIELGTTRVHYAVLRAPGVTNAVTNFDFDRRSVTTTVTLAPGAADPAQLRATAVRAAKDGVTDPLPDSIDIDVVENAGPELGGIATHYGGEVLSGGACTSGFTARTSSPTSGSRVIVTAGHCSNQQSDDGTALSMGVEHYGSYGDFQWMYGPQTTADDFYAGSSTATETDLRDVAAIGTAVVGQSLCANGLANHKSCQEVRSTNSCNGPACRLVQMGERHNMGGRQWRPDVLGEHRLRVHTGVDY